MKKHMIILGIFSIVLPLCAQESNEANPPSDAAETVAAPAQKPKDDGGKKFEERHLRLMEKVLKDIGVTEEQRKQIVVLQEEHMEKMKANWMRINEARRELSRLQDEGASIEALDAAIQEVSDAQTEQLQILVRNRLEMERILGKEKSDQFMEQARQFYRSRGRRPGSGMPPRPDSEAEGPPPPTPPPTANQGKNMPSDT